MLNQRTVKTEQPKHWRMTMCVDENGKAGPCKTAEDRVAHLRKLADGGLNLDGMSADDCMAVWAAIHVRPVVCARVLFPDDPKGARKVACQLGHYASNKATAMRCRERGDIQAAQVYERICEGIYSALPMWARW